MMAKIFLRKKITDRIAKGHPWIFANEIGDVTGAFAPGEIVSVFSSNGSFVGCGFINPASQIRIRLLTRNQDTAIDEHFIAGRIGEAWRLREQLGYRDHCRVVFSEADHLPGLIVDKFGEQLVFQTLSLGMDLWKEVIIDTLSTLFRTRKIYEKNTAPVRNLEGLGTRQGFVADTFDNPVTLTMDRLPFCVDLIQGIKTGFCWEQRTIAAALSGLVRDADVLDVFGQSGFVGLKLLQAGARNVTMFDNDPAALRLADINARLNGCREQLTRVEGNSFDLLNDYHRRSRPFDLVVLDPPILAHARKQPERAKAAYKELNLRSLKLLRKGGFLLTCCSASDIDRQDFIAVIEDAARDAGKQLRVIAGMQQPPDHPIIWHIPSTRYFQGFLLSVG